MKNELLRIGPLTLYGYGFMIAIGVLAAWLVVEQRARKLHLACEHIFYLVLWCVLGGFASAKILFWLQNGKKCPEFRWRCLVLMDLWSMEEL